MADLIRRVAEAALREADRLVAEWLPGGFVRGPEWVCGDLQGGPGESLSVNRRTGLWADFAGGAKGGDLVSLYAAIHGLRQFEAAKALAAELRVEDDARPAPAPAPVRQASSVDLHPPAACPDWRHLLVHRSLGTASAHWIYRWPDGSLCCVVIRWETPSGKEIRTACWNGSAWELKRAGAAGFPVYRAEYLTTRQVVVVTEGEKAADAAVLLLGDRAAVVTSIGGASAWKLTDWAMLAGRQVYVWPDQDDPGEKYAAAVAKQCPGAVVLDWGWIRAIAPAAISDQPRCSGYDAADLVEDLQAAGIDAADHPVPALPGVAAPRPAAGTGTAPAGQTSAPARMLPKAAQRVLDTLAGLGLTADATTGWLRSATLSRAAVTLSDGELGARTWWAAHLVHEASDREEGYYQKIAGHLVREQREARRAWLTARLLGHPATAAGRDAATALLRAMVPDADEVDLAVFLHWLWQVKRRAAGLPADRELMPVFVGPQETGKTSTLQRLASPWCELTIPVNVDTLTDPRYIFILGLAVVGIWDEMAGAGRADEAKLKNIITAEQASARALYSNSVQSIAKTCSFIGSANIPVSELINDQTGMRRFYEYRVDTVCCFAAINGLDMALVWSAVSEADADPLSGEHLRTARQRQDGLRRRDQVAQWLDFETDDGWRKVVWLPAGAPEASVILAYNPAIGYTLSELQARYRIWCQTTGVGGFNPAGLRQRLIQEKWQHRKIGPREQRGTERWFRPEAPAGVTPAVTAPAPVEPSQQGTGAAAVHPAAVRGEDDLW
jgi:hypothetical protein